MSLPPLETTQIQWGGPNAPWHDDADLKISIASRDEVIPEESPPPAGTRVSWGGPNGGGNVTFFEDNNRLEDSAQFPGEGPVGYRGTTKS